MTEQNIIATQVSEPLLDVLLKQAPIVILAVVMMYVMFRYFTRELRASQKLSDERARLLAENEVRHSEELLAMQRTYYKEREQMRTDLLLQCDSMSRNTLAFLKDGLLETLKVSEDNSDG